MGCHYGWHIGSNLYSELIVLGPLPRSQAVAEKVSGPLVGAGARMSEPATFDYADWRELTASDKRALWLLSRLGSNFEPLAKTTGVGQHRMDSLLAKGLAVEGPASVSGRTFKITDKGWLACEWLKGNRLRTYPRRD